MRFKYNARNEQGELQAGFVEAGGKDAALDILRSHNLFILNLENVEGESWLQKIFGFFGRVSVKDLMIFTRQFSILLESKVPLSDALRSLERQTSKPILKEAIREVNEGVSSGLSLSQAMERQSNVFSDFYVNMVRPAEVTGRLEQAVGFLADYLEKESIWISRTRNVLIYPIIVIGLFLVVAAIMIMVVFPQLQPVFTQSNVELPLITKIFLNLGGFVLNWWLPILISLVLLVVLSADYLRSNEGKLVLDEIKIRLPIFGQLFRKIYVARFAESVSILIKGGIPLTQSIEVAGRAMQNVIYSEILHDIAEGVKRGDLFSAMLSVNDKYFPPIVGEIVAIGEGAGRMDQVLANVSGMYTREVNDLLNTLVELIQPALIIGIGVFVGLLFASILLPIYNLAKTF